MNTSRKLTIGIAAALACSLVSIPAQVAHAAPASRSVALARAPQLVTPIAVSGTRVLVQADGTFRLSNNSGKTWRTAHVYCPDRSSCDPTMYPSMVGRVSGGIVAFYHHGLPGTVSAYSLESNAVVGRPYKLTREESVQDLNGAFVLLHSESSGAMSVRSLVDQSVRQLPGTAAYELGQLLSDGSVIVHNNDSPAVWDRIDTNGSVSPFISSLSRAPVVSGSMVAYPSGDGSLCLTSPATALAECRSGLGSFSIAQVSARGVLIQHDKRARWLPITNGRLGAPSPVKATLTGANYQHAVSVEKAYPVIAQKTSTGIRMLTLRSGGRLGVHHLGWARSSVLPPALQLTPTTVLSSDSSFTKSWYRNAVSSLGASRAVATSGEVQASGARWAVSGSALVLYDRGRKDRQLGIDGTALKVSGTHLLVAPSCHPALSDPDPTCPTPEIYDISGRRLATIAAQDIFGDLAVVSDGPLGAARVVRYPAPAETIASFNLPDPGVYGRYADLQLWGDWVAGTRDEATDRHAVVYNYRTGQLRVSPSSATLTALGDGFAVINTFRADNDRQLQVWNLATGAMTTLSSVSSVTATDGSRVAYLSGDPFNRFTKARLTVASFASLARTAPRTLGVVAPGTWKKSWHVDIDLTKAVRAGRLEFRDAGGQLIRSLKVPASRDGSIRNIRWDGKDSGGRLVAAGTYTYRLTSVAADGTGGVRAPDGSASPVGTVVVR